MPLKLKPPLPPAEALLVDEIPVGPEWQYEPKWDGFRCVVFRDGDQVELQSKSMRPLARYFPDVVIAVQAIPAKQFVLDSEIVIPMDRQLSFEQLQLRLHPAESRVRKLAAEYPATLITFDLLLSESNQPLLKSKFSERRAALEAFAAKYLVRNRSVRLSPATSDIKLARNWLKGAGATVDGIIAKRLDMDYRSGERTAMFKVKNLRTADCVVGGFRYASKAKVVGSLLLGLYDDAGLLQHVGYTSALAADEKRALTKRLEALRKPPGFTGAAPGGPSRWATEKTSQWEPLSPKLVVEVQYDHFTGDRFRHGTRLLRWRPDKRPRDCTMDQVKPRGGKPLELLD